MEKAAKTDKLANTVLYLLDRCGAQRPGKQALLKMLWYADYWHYREHLTLITEAEYVAMKNGPVIRDYQAVFSRLEKEGVVECQEVPVYGKADDSLFTETELSILEQVIAQCGGRSGTELSARTHLEGPWQLVWNEQNPNQPIHPTVFRWLDNLPDEADCAKCRDDVSQPDVQKEIEALRKKAPDPPHIVSWAPKINARRDKMSVSDGWFDQPEPVLLRREDGGWLAVSPSGAPVRVGVAAWSAEDARVRFAREVREWRLLLERTE